MKQYIDKSAVIAWIEKEQKALKVDNFGGRIAMAMSKDLKNFLNTLEVKEMD